MKIVLDIRQLILLVMYCYNYIFEYYSKNIHNKRSFGVTWDILFEAVQGSLEKVIGLDNFSQKKVEIETACSEVLQLFRKN